MGNAAGLHLFKVLLEPVQNFSVLFIAQFAFNFGESKVDDVMVVDFLRFQALAAVEPDLVQQVDFIWS